jgi:integrase
MTVVNSTAPAEPRKPRKPDGPKKPHKDFPLFPSSNGQWCKKVLGKLRCFGSWRDDPKGARALERWLAEKDDLLGGRVPRGRKTEAIVLHVLVNSFLNTKRARVDSGELKPLTWHAYNLICAELVAEFGRDRLLSDIRPEDFEKLRGTLAAKWGPVRLKAEMTRARTVFNYGYDNELLEKPMRFGEGFKVPSKQTIQLHKAAQGPKMFEADELRKMIRAATQPMKAMLLLAINSALGPNDIALLPTSALDLKAGWMTHPRTKNGISRRCPLWPETVKAIRAWLAERPAPAEAANSGLVFLTYRGNSWAKSIHDRAISHECRKLLDKLEINGKRNFYAIRHSFETIAGDSRDQIAVNVIMGHADASMAGTYRERIEDDRLQAVVTHVRTWLFGK